MNLLIESYLDHIKDGVINGEQVSFRVCESTDESMDKPFVLNLDSTKNSELEEGTRRNKDKGDDSKYKVANFGSTRTVKIYEQNGNKEDEQIKSPCSIKRMLMEVTPPRQEMEPLIGGS
ncbi:C2 domain containing protein [Cryptosporidium felis]|nr:C2 domain containing protein [Cryptosporidium felis]